MNRQITITLNNIQYMIDIDVERRGDATVYHVAPNRQLEMLPAGLDIVKPDNAEQPKFNEQSLTPKARQAVDEILRQLKMLPPQFKGGK